MRAKLCKSGAHHRDKGINKRESRFGLTVKLMRKLKRQNGIHLIVFDENKVLTYNVAYLIFYL